MKAIITIPEPCAENWDAMQPADQGRHCTACALTVVDFTGWALADIADYLHVQAGQRICGRFNNTQLNQPFNLTEFVPEIIRWKANGLYKIAALIVVCFALATTSCNTHERTNGEPHTEQKTPDMRTVGVTIPADSFHGLDDTGTVKGSVPIIKKKKSKMHEEMGIAIEGPGNQSQGVPLMEYPPEARLYPPPKDTIHYKPLIGPPPEPPVPVNGSGK
jgi:hypothetical protein